MKAKRRTLLVMVVLIVLMGAAFALLTRQNEKTAQAESEAADGTIPLAAVSAEELTRIRITYQGETNTLDYTDGGWSLEEDPAYHLDSSTCNTMLTALSSFNAKRELTPQAGEDYGFDAPAVTVEVTAAGQTDVYTFGASNSVTGDLYVRKNDAETLYTVSGSKASCFEVAKEDLFGAFQPAGLTTSAIESVTYTMADGETVTLKANSEPVADSETDSESASDGTAYQTVWRLADDPTADLNQTRVDAILSALSSYASAQITEADPAEYGFDTPSVTATVTTADGAVTVTYAVGTDGCYLMTEGDDSIYTVDSNVISNLLVTAEQLKTE